MRLSRSPRCSRASQSPRRDACICIAEAKRVEDVVVIVVVARQRFAAPNIYTCAATGACIAQPHLDDDGDDGYRTRVHTLFHLSLSLSCFLFPSFSFAFRIQRGHTKGSVITLLSRYQHQRHSSGSPAVPFLLSSGYRSRARRALIISAYYKRFIVRAMNARRCTCQLRISNPTKRGHGVNPIAA